MVTDCGRHRTRVVQVAGSDTAIREEGSVIGVPFSNSLLCVGIQYVGVILAWLLWVILWVSGEW